MGKMAAERTLLGVGRHKGERGGGGGEKYNVKILFENAIMKPNFLKVNKMKTKTNIDANTTMTKMINKSVKI